MEYRKSVADEPAQPSAGKISSVCLLCTSPYGTVRQDSKNQGRKMEINFMEMDKPHNPTRLFLFLWALKHDYGYNYDNFVCGFKKKDHKMFLQRYGKMMTDCLCCKEDLQKIEEFIFDIGPEHFCSYARPNFIDWKKTDQIDMSDSRMLRWLLSEEDQSTGDDTGSAGA